MTFCNVPNPMSHSKLSLADLHQVTLVGVLAKSSKKLESATSVVFSGKMFIVPAGDRTRDHLIVNLAS